MVTNFVISFPRSTQVHIIHFGVKNATSSGINNPSLSVMHSLKWKWCSMKETSEFSPTPSVTGVLLPEMSTGDQYEEVLSMDFLIFTYNVKKMWRQGSKISNCFLFFFFCFIKGILKFNWLSLKMQRSSSEEYSAFWYSLLPWLKLRHQQFYPPLLLHWECKLSTHLFQGWTMRFQKNYSTCWLFKCQFLLFAFTCKKKFFSQCWHQVVISQKRNSKLSFICRWIQE